MVRSAFEIVESDGLDATSGKVDVNGPSKTKANVNANKIEKLMAKKDVDPQAVMQFVQSTYKVDSFDKLNDADRAKQKLM